MAGARASWSPEKYEELFGQLRAHARRVIGRRKVEWRRGQGCPMIGATVEDLVNDAFEHLLANKPPINLLIETPLKYCQKRIDYTAKAICDRDENRLDVATFIPVSHTDARELDEDGTQSNLAIISDPSVPEAIFQSADAVGRLLNILAQTKPELVALFHMQIQQDTDPAMEAQILGLEIQEVYRLRKELAAAKVRFYEIHYRGVGARP
jgi:hypothetical protein